MAAEQETLADQLEQFARFAVTSTDDWSADAVDHVGSVWVAGHRFALEYRTYGEDPAAAARKMLAGRLLTTVEELASEARRITQQVDSYGVRKVFADEDLQSDITPVDYWQAHGGKIKFMDLVVFMPGEGEGRCWTQVRYNLDRAEDEPWYQRSDRGSAVFYDWPKDWRWAILMESGG